MDHCGDSCIKTRTDLIVADIREREKSGDKELIEGLNPKPRQRRELEIHAVGEHLFEPLLAEEQGIQYVVWQHLFRETDIRDQADY